MGQYLGFTRNGVTDLGYDLELELVYSEAVLSRGRGLGIHITPSLFLRRATARLTYRVSAWGNRAMFGLISYCLGYFAILGMLHT